VNALATVDWALVNARVLGVFGPILVLTSVAGFLIPPRRPLMRGAPAYNIFDAPGGPGLAAVGWLGLR
jgi:hypothetical protein